MNKEILYVGGGLLAGVIITLAVLGFAHNRIEDDNGKTIHNMMMRDDETNSKNSTMMDHSMDSSMNTMTVGLQGKTGDEFDKTFLTEMITHHQGAIAMANLALTNASHQEIKDLAKAIISAQTTEIDQMKQWQQSWYNN